MRKHLLVMLLFLLNLTALYADSLYRVNCNSVLNVRKEMSASAPVLGVLQNQDVVTVYQIQNGWAKIKFQHQDGFISADYISFIEEVKPDAGKEATESVLSSGEKLITQYLDFSLDKDTTWALFLIIPLLLLTWHIDRRMEQTAYNNPNMWNLIRGFTASILLLSIAELIYISGTQDFIWFCKEPRWWWMVVNFILFAILTYGQVMSYLSYVRLASNAKVHIGIYSWPVAIVAGLICLWMEVDIIYVLIAVLLAQAIQTLIIFRQTARDVNVFYALVFSAVYLLFTYTTIILLFQFVIVLILVAIGALAVWLISAIGSSSSGSNSKSSDIFTASEPETPTTPEEEKERYETPDGYELHYDGFGEWHDDKGREYKEMDSLAGKRFRRIDDRDD